MSLGWSVPRQTANDLAFIRPAHLAASYAIVETVLDIVERDCRPRNILPKCEPQLGRRGLYHGIGGDKDAPAKNMAMLWVLNLSDGTTGLLDIARRAKMDFRAVRASADLLEEHGLLAEVAPSH